MTATIRLPYKGNRDGFYVLYQIQDWFQKHPLSPGMSGIVPVISVSALLPKKQNPVSCKPKTKLLYFAVFILRSIPSRICRDKSVNGTDKGSCGQKYLQDPDFYYKSKRTPLSESPFASSWQEY